MQVESQIRQDVILTDEIPFQVAKEPFKKPVEEQNLEKPRYLFTALNAIEPRMLRERRDRPELRAGGMMIPSACLRHVDGFVRRGVITALLENVYDPVAREEAEGSDQKGSYLELPALPSNDPLGIPALNPLKTRLAKPGAHLPQLLNGSSNVRGGNPKGLVEIQALKFEQPDPVKLDFIHRSIFPTWPRLPIRIKDLREQINEKRLAFMDSGVHGSDFMLSITEDMLASCEQAEQYMVRVIDQVHFQMRHTTGQSGQAPQYTGLHLVFLEQLGLEPQARELQDIARRENMPFDWKEMFSFMREAAQQDREAFLDTLKSFTGPSDEPNKEAAPEETETHACECGKSFDTPQGLAIHKTRHCSLKNGEPQTSEV